ncbi:unnamed protein product [Prunus brigantina]
MNGFFLQSTTTPRKACKGIEIFIGGVLESHSRLKRSSKKYLPDGQVVQSTFGIVKHGGVTPINLGKSRPPP